MGSYPSANIPIWLRYNIKQTVTAFDGEVVEEIVRPTEIAYNISAEQMWDNLRGHHYRTTWSPGSIL